MKTTLLADHPHEIKKIAKWYYNEWADIAPNVTEEMLYDKVAEKAINREELPLSIVLHDDDDLVGVVELKYRENKNYPEYIHWLGGVYVAPLRRGNGYASSLISVAKNKAVSLGIKKLYLQCESYNVTLYKKHGFKELHQASHYEVTTSIMVFLIPT